MSESHDITKKEYTTGQKIATTIISEGTGIGAGVIAGSLAMAAVESIPGIGKVLKTIMKLGCYGIEYTVYRFVKREMKSQTEEWIDAINNLRTAFTLSAGDQPIETNGEVT